MQPNRDMVEAERTTTITLPATLTRAPSPAPTIIWASWTMQVSAAQSTPVPRGLWLPPLSFICSWKHSRGRVREQENKRKKKSDVINFLYYLEMSMSKSNHHLSKQVQLWKILRGNLIYLFRPPLSPQASQPFHQQLTWFKLLWCWPRMPVHSTTARKENWLIFQPPPKWRYCILLSIIDMENEIVWLIRSAEIWLHQLSSWS